jgi:hypothetical protein
VLDAILNSKAIAEELVSDFQASDRFFKYKVAVIAAWAAMSALTLVLACPSARTDPSNRLSAEAHVEQVPTLDSAIPVVVVQNRSETPWQDVRFILNGTYASTTAAVTSRGKAIVEIRKFIGPNGRPPATAIAPETLTIQCSEGEVTLALEKPPGASTRTP